MQIWSKISSEIWILPFFAIYNVQHFYLISTLCIVLGLVSRVWSAGSDCD